MPLVKTELMEAFGSPSYGSKYVINVVLTLFNNVNYVNYRFPTTLSYVNYLFNNVKLRELPFPTTLNYVNYPFNNVKLR